MSNEIYNEGRVVGFSAEEIFDKVFHAQFPDEELPTTQEWLSTSMGMGASFALHINKTTTSRGVITYNLPKGYSNPNNNLYGLSGRYLIIATPIFGTVTTASSSATITAITKIEDITLDATMSNADTTEFSKILDGIIVYNNSGNSTVKLLVDGTCTCDILLTGFLNSNILKALALTAGTNELGRKYTTIDEFGNTLMPDVSQIHFAKPNYREYFKANVIDTDGADSSLIDISQVKGNSTLSTNNSIITPTRTTIDFANQHGEGDGDSSTHVPNLFSVQQHSYTNGGTTTTINPSLYFYNPTTKKLEPVDSDARGAVNVIRRFQFTSNEANDLQALNDRISNMTQANKDKIFIGAWVTSASSTNIEYLILPGGNVVGDLGDLLTTLKNSGEGSVRLYVSEPTSMPSDYASYTNYGIWD